MYRDGGRRCGVGVRVGVVARVRNGFRVRVEAGGCRMQTGWLRQVWNVMGSGSIFVRTNAREAIVVDVAAEDVELRLCLRVREPCLSLSVL